MGFQMAMPMAMPMDWQTHWEIDLGKRMDLWTAKQMPTDSVKATQTGFLKVKHLDWRWEK